jgi:hypothetical protein
MTKELTTNPAADILGQQPVTDIVAPLLAMDSTTIADVVSAPANPVLDAISSAASKWIATLDQKKFDKIAALAQGKEVLDKSVRAFNKENDVSIEQRADAAIQLGNIGLGLKRLAKTRNTGGFGKWVAENLSFISQRSLERYMNLARRNDCHAYTFVGIEVLENLCAVTEDLTGEDRIGNFLEKYKISRDQEQPVEEFKLAIDTALNCEVLESYDIEVTDFTAIGVLTSDGWKFDEALLKTLKKQAGAKPEEQLVVLANDDKKRKEFIKEVKKSQRDFANRSSKFMQYLESILKKEEELEKIDPKNLADLADKIKKIQDKITAKEAPATM